MKHFGDPLQTTRADAVDALLVFLNLLKGHADLLGKPLLAHSEQLPARPDARSDIAVYGIWCLDVHWVFSASIAFQPAQL
ncbi:UNVERIFIED_ORG: hypothetical protein GGD59_003340 [Rhizobium esperanzae]